jgi:hypothetical protein
LILQEVIVTAVPDNWTKRLASAIAVALREYGLTAAQDKPIVAIDVGCFPWHGSVELSILTAEDLDANRMLLEPGEIAAWRHYNFADGSPAWAPTAELGRQMADAYYAAEESGRSATVDAFLRACAAAVASPEVQEAIRAMPRDQRFRISVIHPDNGTQFWPPGVG